MADQAGGFGAQNDAQGASLCGFSRGNGTESRGKYFGMVSADNRIRLWDTNAGELARTFEEQKYLSAGYTALDIVTCQPPAGQNSGTAGDTLLALGTSKGSVVIWSLRKGKILRKLGSGKLHKSVKDVAFDDTGRMVYSALEDG
eukprot:1386120-Amorphochlora_amoeboformis.AAC.1